MILSVFPIHSFNSVSPFLFFFFLFRSKQRPHRTEKYCTACGIAKGWDKRNVFCRISEKMFLIFFHQKMKESCNGKFLGELGDEETDHATVFEHPNWCLLLGNRFWQMLIKLSMVGMKLFWKHIFCYYSVFKHYFCLESLSLCLFWILD